MASSTPRFFSAKDAPANSLNDERLAIIGYGCLGRPMALNLRDSGQGRSIVVGNIADAYADAAREEGFDVLPIGDAVARADVVWLCLPDEVIADVFARDIAPHLLAGAALVVASGFCLAYQLIQPPTNRDLLLLAPRMAGANARQRFLEKRGFYAYIAVERDASGRAWQRLLGLCDAAGVLHAGALEVSARDEANLDLFVEQTLGSMLGAAVLSTYSVGMEAGFSPEILAMEMYHSQETEEVWRSFRDHGFFRAALAHGPTALFGGFLRTMQFLGDNIEQRFRDIFKEIDSGHFARQFEEERKAGYPKLSMIQAMGMEDPAITRAENNLRERLNGDHPQ